MISAILFISVQGCEKDKNDVIPDVYVDFYIDLGDPEFASLIAPGNYALVNALTNNLGQPAAGFSGNGIIIYHAEPGVFLAFDRTCPHDYVTDGSAIKLNVDGIYAVCPVCGTNYALPSYGTPSSGPGRYPLKNYRTSYNPPLLHVWNHL
ncbi:MAG: hypothetical protein IH591_09790 [Bacteroidales bacterium]|nr:hypothetical protein [Bacteroidales bacterium]